MDRKLVHPPAYGEFEQQLARLNAITRQEHKVAPESLRTVMALEAAGITATPERVDQVERLWGLSGLEPERIVGLMISGSL